MTPRERLQLLAAIGADRYSVLAEVVWASDGDAWAHHAWEVYEQHFDRFTGARLDPEFERLRNPVTQNGTIRVERRAAVIVVGTGPSLAAQATVLRTFRDRVLLFTSPRGAAALRALDITPDVVVVEHASAIDAELSVEFGAHAAIPAQSWVATEARTPAALLDGADPQRLFVPDEWPGWGCWPATAVALALQAGAGRVGLLGVDLGTSAAPDPRFAPTTALLGLLADTEAARCVDLGGGAPKRGWFADSLDHFADGAAPAFRIDMRAMEPGAPIAEASQWRSRSDELLTRARQALAMAEAARDSGRLETAVMAANAMMSWRSNKEFAAGVERILGASFLPRLWRERLNVRRLDRPWRPVILGVYELLAQADRLDAALAAHGYGATRG
jgi:hypothetical protein